MKFDGRKFGSTLYRWWMAFARAIAFVNTRLILTIVYVIIIGPIALIVRIAGRDFLDRTMGRAESYWKQREHSDHTLENASRQF